MSKKSSRGSQEDLREATESFIKANGTKEFIDDKVNFVMKAAMSVVSMDDPSIKIKKASRELDYDSVSMDKLRERVRCYMNVKDDPSFVVFWEILKRMLFKLEENDKISFEKIVKGIFDRKVSIGLRKTVFNGNFVSMLKTSLRIDGVHVDEFIRNLYAVNVKMGSRPSGKGEFLVILFVEGAVKSSDVKIDGVEYEIKTDSSAAIGESLGSKQVYISKLSEIYEESGKSLDYSSMSFGRKIFVDKWSKLFVSFTEENASIAKKFLEQQYFFYNGKKDASFSKMVDKYIENPSYEKLSSLYDNLCIEYVRKNTAGKSLLVFQEDRKSRSLNGNFVILGDDHLDEAISFSGSSRETLVKVFLPKGSATMRPEIEKLNVR